MQFKKSNGLNEENPVIIGEKHIEQANRWKDK